VQLVDATEQGLKLKQHVLKNDKNIAYQLPIPKWIGEDYLIKKNGRNKNFDVGDDNGNGENNDDEMIKNNAMDMLYMFIKEEKNVIESENFKVVTHPTETIDPHIRLFWLHEMEHAKKIEDGGAYMSDLLLIESFTHDLVYKYNSKYYDSIINCQNINDNGKDSETTSVMPTTTTTIQTAKI